MKRRELVVEMTRLARDAAGKAVRREAELAAARGPAVPGDVLIIPTNPPLIHWLIVKLHPEASQHLFMVPGDNGAAVGPADVGVAEDHPWGPITFRCGSGLWADADLLARLQRAGVMGEEVLQQVRTVLAGLAAGTLRPTDEQLLVGADGDYHTWLSEVEKSRAAVSRWLAEAGQVCHTREMAAEAPAALRRSLSSISPPETNTGLELAAEGNGLRGRLARRLADASRPRWLALQERGVYIVADGRGVRVVWTKRSPIGPRVQGVAGNALRPAIWARAGAVLTTQLWPWVEDRVELRIGDGEGRKVVIRR
jgi:hypothetical protein